MIDTADFLVIIIGTISLIALFNVLRKINVGYNIYDSVKNIDYKNDMFVFIFLQGCLLLFSLNTSDKIETIKNTNVVIKDTSNLKKIISIIIIYFIFLFTIWFILNFFGYNTKIIKTEDDIVLKNKISFTGELLISLLVLLGIIFAIFHFQNPGKIRELTNSQYIFTSYITTLVIPTILVIILLENTVV